MELNDRKAAYISELNISHGLMSDTYAGRVSIALSEGTINLRLTTAQIEDILSIVEPLRKQSDELSLPK